jgi:serine protease Do
MRTGILIGLCAVLSFAQTQRTVVMGGTYIGVGMQEIDGERAKALKLHEAGGVEITVVEQDSPAEKAGLKTGDVLLRYNGQRVEGMEHFARMVRETPAGREVKIDISRDGATQTVAVRVAQRKVQKLEWSDSAPLAGSWPFDIHLPDLPRTFMTLRSSALGVEAESIDGQLAQYFGVKEGVLVRSVLKGSAAEKAGIKAGDVIMKIDDAHVATPADISGQLRSLHGKSAVVLLMRDHKEVTVTAGIGDDDPGGRLQITPFQVQPKPNQL